MQKSNCPTVYRQELRERILSASMDEFCQRGVRAVKMDDIAAKLAISKRTLYEIYANKESLLLEGLKLNEEHMDEKMRAFSENKSCNVIEIIIQFYTIQIKNSANVNPLFFEDLHRYPSVQNFFEKKRMERGLRQQLFFKRGVSEGFFRDDVDYDILARICEASMEYVMRTQMYREYKLDYILHNLTLLYVRGICTEDGVRALDEALESTEL